jgi:hypothetical protein
LFLNFLRFRLSPRFRLSLMTRAYLKYLPTHLNHLSHLNLPHL